MHGLGRSLNIWAAETPPSPPPAKKVKPPTIEEERERVVWKLSFEPEVALLQTEGQAMIQLAAELRQATESIQESKTRMEEKLKEFETQLNTKLDLLRASIFPTMESLSSSSALTTLLTEHQ
jgi:hypothetical protein